MLLHCGVNLRRVGLHRARLYSPCVERIGLESIDILHRQASDNHTDIRSIQCNNSQEFVPRSEVKIQIMLRIQAWYAGVQNRIVFQKFRESRNEATPYRIRVCCLNVHAVLSVVASNGNTTTPLSRSFHI